MKSVTIRDLGNHFAKISAWLDQGEEVMITKRGRSYARIVLIEHEKPSVKIDFQQRLKVIYGEKLLKNPADRKPVYAIIWHPSRGSAPLSSRSRAWRFALPDL